MKHLIYLLLGFFIWQSALSQTNIKTENVSNIYKTYTAATTGDTLNTVKTTSETQFLVRLAIGTPVASDTIIIKNGTGTAFQLIEPASAPFIYSAELGFHVDTSIVYIQKKASVSTLIYRKTY